MFARIALALPLGAAITAGLLFTMHLLIDTGAGHSDTRAVRVIDFVRVEREEAVQITENRPDKPEPLESAPDMAQTDYAESFSNSIEIAFSKPDIRFSADLGRTGISVSDGEYLPIVKVAPVYPMRALQRRVEGYVIVEFVVTSSGAVTDVKVVESSAPLFEQAAIEAAQKFRYKPRVVDGMAIEVSGVQNRITFKLDA
jgi:protein TonB